MQSVAAEMNLAETAFPLREGDGFRLRWFTPKVEVKLCGHATLATAHILWETGLLPPDREARFQTLSGNAELVRNSDSNTFRADIQPKDAALEALLLRRAIVYSHARLYGW